MATYLVHHIASIHLPENKQLELSEIDELNLQGGVFGWCVIQTTASDISFWTTKPLYLMLDVLKQCLESYMKSMSVNEFSITVKRALKRQYSWSLILYRE